MPAGTRARVAEDQPVPRARAVALPRHDADPRGRPGLGGELERGRRGGRADPRPAVVDRDGRVAAGLGVDDDERPAGVVRLVRVLAGAADGDVGDRPRARAARGAPARSRRRTTGSSAGRSCRSAARSSCPGDVDVLTGRPAQLRGVQRVRSTCRTRPRSPDQYSPANAIWRPAGNVRTVDDDTGTLGALRAAAAGVGVVERQHVERVVVARCRCPARSAGRRAWRRRTAAARRPR